jgi:hypothetical protein
VHRFELLKADEAEHTMTRGESLHLASEMLIKARDQVRGHADVQRPIFLTGENLDARLSLTDAVHAEEWMLKQVQHDGVWT